VSRAKAATQIRKQDPDSAAADKEGEGPANTRIAEDVELDVVGEENAAVGATGDAVNAVGDRTSSHKPLWNCYRHANEP
jgi:hypothetical protein